MPVITVARQYGSLGDDIAAAVASTLGLTLVDHDIVIRVAERLGVAQSTLNGRDERDTGVVADLVRTMRRLYPAAVGAVPSEDATEIDEATYLKVTRQIIWEIARGNDVVIVGRGAAFVLNNGPEFLHVLLIAPFKTRVERVATARNVSKKAAAQEVRDADGSRARYIRHYYRANWLDANHYDLVVNTARFTETAAADLICRAALPGE